MPLINITYDSQPPLTYMSRYMKKEIIHYVGLGVGALAPDSFSLIASMTRITPKAILKMPITWTRAMRPDMGYISNITPTMADNMPPATSSHSPRNTPRVSIATIMSSTPVNIQYKAMMKAKASRVSPGHSMTTAAAAMPIRPSMIRSHHRPSLIVTAWSNDMIPITNENAAKSIMKVARERPGRNNNISPNARAISPRARKSPQWGFHSPMPIFSVLTALSAIRTPYKCITLFL